ncbi:MAG TPA: 2-hydroxyacyl-CoA dehydratase family protein [Methanospirillum sp.]|uniref:2-hydroxyacyl-CoA dehydratase subunit D n=1 Tax=Methanospirillum sp. TaxID=45200 RepID=UPI002CBAF8EB|nr:2-hydroxyacyl-CoA dehydratase family protein [Methanospirillum sp.]HWQ63320.1 2-hydroxyacyl-CoA dehydratase family protein [Methanospirillum sp.]
MTLSALKQIRDAVEQRPSTLVAEKNNGKIVVGWFGYFIPEEIVHALGMIPVRLGRGGDERLVELGARYISSQNCAFIRASMGMFAENSDPYIRAADVVAFDNACMQIYRLGEVSKYYFKKKTLFLGVPRNPQAESSQKYFRQEMEHFTQNLEKIAGKKIDTLDLAESILLYQTIRNCTKKLFQSLLIPDSPLHWKEVIEVVHAGYYLDKKNYLSLLQELLSEIDSGSVKSENKSPDVRVILSGSAIAPGDEKLVDLIEQMNGTIVRDDLWTGLNPSLNMNIEHPSVSSIADAYMNRIPHYTLPCIEKDNDIRFEHLMSTVLETKANGVIYHTIRYCDSATFKTTGLKNRLKNAGIPLLEIHTEYSGSDVEAIRTRVEAFFEILKAQNQTEVKV